MDDQLTAFVDHARERGLDHATIRRLLLSAGWRERPIADALCARELELSIPQPEKTAAPPPRARAKPGSPWPRRARDAFLHILAFGSLHAFATSLILLLFTFIEFAHPDPAWRSTRPPLEVTYSLIRFQLSVLIVAFPVFLVLWHYLLREVRRDAVQAKGAIRRWFTYLTLFVGAVALAGDVMTLVYFWLEGQMTARLLLKSAVLFVIAGSLVLYLLYTLRSESRMEASA